MAKKQLDNSNLFISKDDLQLLARVSQDVFLFSEFCYVVNPIKGKVKFKLYPYQKSVLYQFVKERFNIILKFRQAGITELISMYCLWLTMYHPNKKVNIISIKDITAKKVLKKIKFMYKNLPPILRTPIINGRTNEMGSSSLMEFDNGSFIESIPTSPEAGRSEALTLLVIDEAAMVRFANEVYAAALPTLSCAVGSTPIFTREYIQVKKNHKKPLTKQVKLRTLCPKDKGVIDISHLGLYTLTHKGTWERILKSQNKGKLETWFVEDNRGKKGGYTPAHKLFTTRGWKTVAEIIEQDLNIIQADTKIETLTKPPVTRLPSDKQFIESILNGDIPGYYTSKLRLVKKTHRTIYDIEVENQHSYISANNFVNHNTGGSAIINSCITGDTEIIGKNGNFRVEQVCPKEFGVQDIRFMNLQVLTHKLQWKKVLYGVNKGILETWEIENDHGDIIKCTPAHKFLTSKGWLPASECIKQRIPILRYDNLNNTVHESYIKCNRVYSDNIYDITVEDDESYITTSNYVSHNTPKGIGGFYHSQWVDAISGVNGLNPIRLYWDMHPERDQAWYEQMSKALGPKRTAQEIDGDFLSSGNTVFDLSDIKAIEDCLSDYPAIKTRFNGQYRQFLEPNEYEQYYIGADVATGRASDYSSFTLMNRVGEEYAIYKGRMAVDKYARLLGDTGQLFNYAKIAPESNDVGLAVTSMLQAEGYPNLYYYQKLLRKKNKSKADIDLVPGWMTTNHNRPIIIENLEKDIREDNIIVKDPFFVQEAYTFIYDTMGRPVALNKHKANTDDGLDDETYSDDDIFGKAICNHIRKQKDNVSTLPQ